MPQELPVLRLAAGLLVEGQLLVGGLVGNPTAGAHAAHEPLADHSEHGRGDEEGLDAHVQEAVEGSDGIGGVHRGEDKVTGER